MTADVADGTTGTIVVALDGLAVDGCTVEGFTSGGVVDVGTCPEPACFIPLAACGATTEGLGVKEAQLRSSTPRISPTTTKLPHRNTGCQKRAS